MNEYNVPSADRNDLELRETADCELEFPIPSDLKSWRGTVDASAALKFSQTQLARFWNDPEFVRKRESSRVSVPFEM